MYPLRCCKVFIFNKIYIRLLGMKRFYTDHISCCCVVNIIANMLSNMLECRKTCCQHVANIVASMLSNILKCLKIIRYCSYQMNLNLHCLWMAVLHRLEIGYCTTLNFRKHFIFAQFCKSVGFVKFKCSWIFSAGSELSNGSFRSKIGLLLRKLLQVL